MNQDFISVICEEFCESLTGVVEEDYLSPQECWDPLVNVLGREFDSERLKQISVCELTRLKEEMNEWFESDDITLEHIQKGIVGTLTRWS